MGKNLRIYSYIRKPFLIYDFAPNPIWMSLYMRTFCFLFYQCNDHMMTSWSKWRFFVTAGDGGGRERPDRPVWPGGSGAGDPGDALLAASRRPSGRCRRRRIHWRHQHGHQAQTDKNRDARLEQGTKFSLRMARKLSQQERKFRVNFCASIC